MKKVLTLPIWIVYYASHYTLPWPKDAPLTGLAMWIALALLLAATFLIAEKRFFLGGLLLVSPYFLSLGLISNPYISKWLQGCFFAFFAISMWSFVTPGFGLWLSWLQPKKARRPWGAHYYSIYHLPPSIIFPDNPRYKKIEDKLKNNPIFIKLPIHKKREPKGKS